MTDNKSVTSSCRSSNQVPENCRCDYSYLRKRGPKFEGETTTQAYYKPYQVQRQPVFEVPKPVPKHYDPEALQTSYKSQYVRPQVPAETFTNAFNSKQLAQSYMTKKPKAPFYSQTEYKKSFEPKPIVAEKQPPYQYKPKQTKFEGQSSYKQQFTAKKNNDLISAGQEVLSAQKLYEQKPRPKFEGESSYKSSFQKHEVKPEKQPEYKYQPKGTKFEGESSYKTSFTKLPESAYKSDLEHCPVHPEKIAIK